MFLHIIVFVLLLFLSIILNVLFQNKELVMKLYKIGIFHGCCNRKTLRETFSICKMFLCTGFHYLLQKYFFKNVYEISPNVYEIKCIMKGKMHVLRLKVKNGPGQVLQITNKNMNDLTVEIEPYVNGYDLETVYITPGDFGLESLYIEKFDGENEIFQKNDQIVLKKKSE
jgi:hypothetical protein